MNQDPSGLVELRDLTGARELRNLTVLHLANPTSPVRDLALITDIEEMTAVGPDTVVLLAESIARGSWMISAALRYAWERRACAIIVPQQSHSDTVVTLARRLGISLLATDRDPTRLAIEVAIHIGVARAGSLARVHSFTQRIAQSADLSSALQLASDELGGARVTIEASGAAALVSPQQLAPDRPPARTVRVSIPIAADAAGSPETDRLVADVLAEAATLGEQILTAAAPSVRALLADARLRLTRESLPVISIAALSGDPRVPGTDDPSRTLLAEELGWPVDGDFVAVFIMTGDPDRVGTAVHQIWSTGMPAAPLARLADGWLGFLPIQADAVRVDLIEQMRSRLDRVGALDLRVGVSRSHSGPEEALESVREAWLAARVADPGDGDGDGRSLVAFDSLTSGLLVRLFPTDLAAQLAERMLPRLFEEPAPGLLVDAVTCFLAHRGSISAASEHLGVHRNTLQTRLRRAEQVGIRLSDPAEVLPMHLLLTALKARLEH